MVGQWRVLADRRTMKFDLMQEPTIATLETCFHFVARY
jgi:hypothetical protein